MKVLLTNLYKISDNYIEVGIIDSSSYDMPQYEIINVSKRKIHGKLENTLLLLEPRGSYIVETNITEKNTKININFILYKIGCLTSPVFFDNGIMKFLIYNTTLNTIFLKKNMIIGET